VPEDVGEQRDEQPEEGRSSSGPIVPPIDSANAGTGTRTSITRYALGTSIRNGTRIPASPTATARTNSDSPNTVPSASPGRSTNAAVIPRTAFSRSTPARTTARKKPETPSETALWATASMKISTHQITSTTPTRNRPTRATVELGTTMSVSLHHART